MYKVNRLVAGRLTGIALSSMPEAYAAMRTMTDGSSS
jgi:hypothetical protein